MNKEQLTDFYCDCINNNLDHLNTDESVAIVRQHFNASEFLSKVISHKLRKDYFKSYDCFAFRNPKDFANLVSIELSKFTAKEQAKAMAILKCTEAIPYLFDFPTL